MALQLSYEEARDFLVKYHFAQSDLPGVFTQLGTVQYDPLNPVGRNPDLVFQARVPGYRVDDWQATAYTDRVVYDAWDKQACLVPVSDWPLRETIRQMYRPYHDREILQADPGLPEQILAAIDAQGPLSSQEFEDRSRLPDNNSWYGLTRTKRVLRAMWACGMLLTHHRKSGRHYYARPAQVIPAQYYNQPLLTDEEAFHRWIILRRHQASGLLRPTAEACIWSACGDSTTRKKAIAQLVEEGTLLPVQVGQKAALYHMPSSALPLLNAAPPPPRVIFLGPLDNFLWDRKAVLQLFNFDYTWEVYKPAQQRRWGYYVLPVFYKNRFIGRLDSRLEQGTWTISRWWWEPTIRPDAELVEALRQATGNFLNYLRACAVRLEEGVDATAREALSTGK
ncbi:winged helix-turn-helix domain-containing protein [Ktedonosporobacter rubrisoli]|uniref:Winged helix-turn-helix domain-containing protein n=1 Tax=Ktedonosporobacter rubrisoli TaxID=2509675 RepID=A0A4P6K0J6_KTERU|nr:crosslink repair DNA glycosylase YcaQ family protein [Ktedonosporobacter rubrisoli]QBD81485.1 winged helix-turn-helix domain-containing protein [Ktedonosporobacter rubrisoli]